MLTLLGLLKASMLFTKYAWFNRATDDFHMQTTGTAWNPAFPAITKAWLLLVVILMITQNFLKIIKLLKGDK